MLCCIIHSHHLFYCVQKTVVSDFTAVPKPAMFFGFLGVLPCMAASVMSVYYADSPELLSFIEPVQVGFGACILSWLGAVHWGLEMAKYNGKVNVRLQFQFAV